MKGMDEGDGGGRLILVFESTSAAFRAEEVLEAADQDYKIVPIPKQVCLDCGFALEIEAGIRGRVLGLLENEKIPPKMIYDPGGSP